MQSGINESDIYLSGSIRNRIRKFSTDLNLDRQAAAWIGTAGILITDNANPNGYRVKNIDTGQESTPRGEYIFVVCVEAPDVVIVAKKEDVHGHESLTQAFGQGEELRPGDVYAAGELVFDSAGQMWFWTNDSGHYRPQPPFQLKSSVKKLLPRHKFRNVVLE